MPKKGMYRKPSMPKPSSGTNTVRNVSNTGAMSSSTQTTGAQGGAVNRTTVISNQGTAGAAGSQTSSIQSISPNVTWDGGTNFQINPNLGTSIATPAPTSDTVRAAFTQVEGELSQARQRALGMVPSEYKDRVNEHFDRASTHVSETKKRLGY